MGPEESNNTESYIQKTLKTSYSPETSTLDSSLARSLRSWTVEEFGHLTQLLGETIRIGKSPEQDLKIMLSLSVIAIKESPEGRFLLHSAMLLVSIIL